MLLLAVKHIIALIHGILKIPDVTLRMELLPWPCAYTALATLEREQQAVKSGCKFTNGPVVDGSTITAVKVVELVRIVLVSSVIAQRQEERACPPSYRRVRVH